MLPEKLKLAIRNYKDDEQALIGQAFLFARKMHRGQKRFSGAPYISHPVRVASSLAADGHNFKLVVAALLHDTIEDTDATKDDLTDLFGEEIANLVESVTKVGTVKLKDKAKIFSNHELYLAQVDNYRKLLFATATDPRGMILKLYDRLDNIRTVRFIPAHKIKFYARETIEIFAPIAERLGMGIMKGKLEDTAFPHAYPEEYAEFKKLIKAVYKNPEEAVKKIIPEVKAALDDAKINYENIAGRAKFQYSLFKKLKRKGSIAAIFDIIALRIIVNTIEECYRVLGLTHSLYSPIPGKITDYIAKPKHNGYQSLHTVVKNKEGHIFEVQIRTTKMHDFAEHGVAAHWSYKENANKASAGQKSDIEWLREMEKLRQISDKEEFLAELEDQLFSEQIFAYTPKGEIIRLPQGSTPIDFAYHIHTKLGERCSGARINGRIMPIGTTLMTGDSIEIIASKTARVSKDWLALAKTASARHKIKAFLKSENSDIMVEQGRDRFEEFLKENNLAPLAKDLFEKKFSNSRLPYKSIEKAFAAIAENSLSLTRFAKVFYPGLNRSTPRKIVVTTEAPKHFSLKGIRHEYARCCKPRETDEVIGYVSREHTIKVHKKSCKHLKNASGARLFELN